MNSENTLQQEVENFRAINGSVPFVGMRVSVNKSAPWTYDWDGVFVVLGICWLSRSGRVDVSLGVDFDDVMTDGFALHDLKVAGSGL